MNDIALLLIMLFLGLILGWALSMLIMLNGC